MQVTRAVGILGVVALSAAFGVVLSALPRGDDAPRGGHAPAGAREPTRPGPPRRGPPAIPPPAPAVARSDPPAGVPPRSRGEGPASARPSATDEATPADEVRRSLDSRFQADGEDRDWAADARLRATAHLTRSLPAGSALRSLECKASICRAEVTQPDLTAHQAFLYAAIASGAGWEGPAAATLASGSGAGPMTTVVYLGRTPSSLVDPVPAESVDVPDPEVSGAR